MHYLASPRFIAVIAMAFAIQIWFMVPLGLFGAHVAASDFLLLYFLGAMAFVLLSGERVTLRIHPYWLAGFFGAMTVLLAFGLYRNVEYTGALSQWGLRYFLDWFVMAGYLLAGIALAAMGDRVKDEFALVFVAINAVICVATYVAFNLQIAAFIPGELLVSGAERPQGLAGNPNVFGRIALCAICLHLAYFSRFHQRFPYLNMAMFAVVVAVLFLIGSRAVWIGAVIAIGIAAFAIRLSWKRIGLGAIAAVPLVLLALYSPFVGGPEINRGFDYRAPAGVTTQKRVEQAQRAIREIKQNPVTGIGLGSYLWLERQEDAPQANYLHNTYLWLWTETGIVGLVLASVFGIGLLVGLYPGRLGVDPQPFAAAGFLIVCVFAAVAAAEDIFRQRFLWLLLGAALASYARGASHMEPRQT